MAKKKIVGEAIPGERTEYPKKQKGNAYLQKIKSSVKLQER